MAAGSGRLITPAHGKRLALAGSAVVPLASGALLPFAAVQGEIALVATSLASGFLGLFLLFAWIQYDRRELGLPRSAGFNAALVWLTAIAAPLYFLRHRVPGRRWQPLLGLFLVGVIGWNILLLGGMIAGGIAQTILTGTP